MEKKRSGDIFRGARFAVLFSFLIAATTAGGSGFAAAEPVTFSQHIAPLIHQKCAVCHRPGQTGPFSLLTLDDVRRRAATIQAVIADGYMPPWKPVNTQVAYANSRRLTEAEQAVLKAWFAQGMPPGDEASTQIPKFPSDWTLGPPDLVLQLKGRFAVPADGPDIYRSFVFAAAAAEDRWVKAVEFRPTARSAVHHALFFVDSSGEARRRDGSDGRPGLSGMSFLRGGRESRETRDSLIRGLGGFVPGAMPNRLPGDLAMLLPAGADIVMQTHFHPSGKPEWESGQLGLYFADRAPSRQLVPIQLPPLFGRFAGIDVPAGEANFEIRDSYTLPVDVEAIAVSGHAHYICREMSVTAALPGGQVLSLLTIDDWDLDWQDNYQFAAPLRLPAGTQLTARLIYDNSADNPANPHSPPQRIRWGRESEDEMGSLTVMVVAGDESQRPALQRSVRAKLAEAAVRGFGIANAQGGGNGRSGKSGEEGASLGNEKDKRNGQGGRGEQGRRNPLAGGWLLRRLDRNGDGQLAWEEVPARFRERAFQSLDRDGDRVLDSNELKAFRGVASGDDESRKEQESK